MKGPWFCPRCGSLLRPRRDLRGTVLRCGCGYEKVAIARPLLDMAKEVLQQERLLAEAEAGKQVYRARVVHASHGIVTLSVRGVPPFHQGDVLGVRRGGRAEYLGVVLDCEPPLLTVVAPSECGVRDGERLELLDYELLKGYDLQLELAEYARGERGRDELEVAVFDERAVELFTDGVEQPELRRASAGEVRDVRDGFRFDESQARVVEAALGLRDGELLVVVGPPGTGKTRVIAKIAYELAERGEKVLVTSHTNRAVDNAVELLPVERALRVGRPEKVSERVRPYLLSQRAREELGRRFEELERRIARVVKLVRGLEEDLERSRDPYARRRLRADLSSLKEELRRMVAERGRMVREASEELVRRVSIVGSTLIKSQLHPLREVAFDTVIVDEASQASVTLALLAMVKAHKWVVVGDHKQLLPVFRSGSVDERVREALSAFVVLRERYKHRHLWLEVHYRSHPEIIGFPAQYVYGGRVRPHESCGRRRLLLRRKPRIAALDPGRPVVFVHVSSRDAAEGGSRVNRDEAYVVAELVRELLGCGVSGGSVGVVTPYRGQRALIAEMLRGVRGVEVNTVDAFQGREKDVVVFDVTDTSQFCFSVDERRLNVAFTRARLKLLVVGNAEAVRARAGGTLLHRFLGYCEAKGSVYDWDSGAWAARPPAGGKSI